jgi:predicted S18 family serine protease
MKKQHFIQPFNSFSAKQKKNHKDKFSLVLEKEQKLQTEFVYSINNFELLLASIERDLLAASIIKTKIEEVDYYNKNKPRNKKKKVFNYKFFEFIALDYFRNKAGIYMFVNKVNKKFYIGKSNDLLTRVKSYTKNTLDANFSNSKIFKAIDKYGFNNFAFSIIEYCPVEELRNREQHYIDLLLPQYNIRRKTNKEYFNKSIITIK